MLRLKDPDSNVFVLNTVVARNGPVQVNNRKAIRDVAGNVSTDTQWSHMAYAYQVTATRDEHDSLYGLWKLFDPVLTASPSLDFTFSDTELFNATWCACFMTEPDFRISQRKAGRIEEYTVQFQIEMTAAVYDAARRRQ